MRAADSNTDSRAMRHLLSYQHCTAAASLKQSRGTFYSGKGKESQVPRLRGTVGLEEWEMSCYSPDKQQNCPLLSLLLWGPQKHAKVNSMLAKMDFIPDTEKVHTDSEN